MAELGRIVGTTIQTFDISIYSIQHDKELNVCLSRPARAVAMGRNQSVRQLTDQKEYKNSEGRVYWSHAVTKQSVWEKPDELKVRLERRGQLG